MISICVWVLYRSYHISSLVLQNPVFKRSFDRFGSNLCVILGYKKPHAKG